MCNEKNYVYILFSHTSSKMGKFICFITKNKYNHVSLSFENDLHRLYSFARYCYSAPFVGGFVEESVLRYCSQHKKSAFVKLCKIPVAPEKYTEMTDYINEIQSHSEQYLYNTLSAILVPVNRKMVIKNTYTCLEFVNHILLKFQICENIQDDRFYTIADLEEILAEYTEYEGDILKVVSPNGWGQDLYYTKKNPLIVCMSTIQHFGKLFHRLAQN